DAALPDPHGDGVGPPRRRRHELDIGAVREAGVDLEVRAVLGDPGRRGVVDEEHEVGVPHSGRVAVVLDAVVAGYQVERARRVDRNPGRIEGDRTHVDGGGDHVAPGVTFDRHGAAPAVGVDHQGPRGPEAVPGGDPGEAAHAVSAHLGDAAVGVEEQHPAVGAVVAGAHHDETVGADAAVTVAEHGGLRSQHAAHAAVLAEPAPDDEVVAGGVELGEAGAVHRDQVARSG